MFGLRKLFQDRYSDKWQVEIVRRDTEGHANYVTTHITDWTFVGKAFKKTQYTEAVGTWEFFQGTIELCMFWLQKMHPSWHRYAAFRLRNTVTNEIIPAELFI